MSDYFLNGLKQRVAERKAKELALENLQAEHAPISTYMDIPSAEKEAAMREMFNQNDQSRRDSVAQMLGMTGNAQDTVKNAPQIAMLERNMTNEDPQTAQIPKTFDSPRENFQKQAGYTPDTPTNIALALEKAKNSGEISPKFLMQMDEAMKRAKVVAGANEKKLGQDAAFKLNDDYVKDSGDFTKVRDAYNKIKASANDPSPAGDLSLLYGYMRLLDPTSTVRESEFATAQQTGNIPTQIVAKYNQLISGEGRLDPTQREDFVNRSEKLYQTALKQQKKTDSTYSQRSKDFGVDPKKVVKDQSAVEEPESLSTFLTRKDIPANLKAKAAILKQRRVDEATILNALKQDAGIK